MTARGSRPGRWRWLALAAAMTACAPAGQRPDGPRAPAPVVVAPRRVEVAVRLIAADGVAGRNRINVGVPLPSGLVTDPGQLQVTAGGRELPAARRALARHPDGSLRSVQLQVDVDVDTTSALAVAINAGAAIAGPRPVAVSDTLVADVDTPRVWALLPASWLAESGVAGRLVTRDRVAATPLAVWAERCDAGRWGTAAFTPGMGERQGWLYDRVTTMLRVHAVTGDLAPLQAAYREAALYRRGVVIADGVATAIPVPGASDDIKYHYAQGLALHYLLTGDDRYREAAEAIALRIARLWPRPEHDGGDGFWTERHAGFALLAYEWAAQVSDDRGAELAAHAEAVVAASLAIQARAPGDASTGRCFAHSATAHGETFGYLGCSPWMSAILADGLDAHARRVGGPTAARIDAALVELGRSIARDGRDASGKPYYWMGAGNGRGEIDEYEEHWGEAAYLVALAWDRSGRVDPGLRRAAAELVDGFTRRGQVGHIPKLNWQCRTAIMTPALLIDGPAAARAPDQPGR